MDAAICSMPGGGVCTSDDSTSFEDLAIYGTTSVIAMGLSIILAMQLDGVSRRFLSPTSLLAKRRREYRYAVEQGNEYTALMIRQHVGGGKGLYDPKTESVVWAKIGSSETEEMDTLLSEIMDAKKATPVIVAIEQDLEDDNNPNDYHFCCWPSLQRAVVYPHLQHRIFIRECKLGDGGRNAYRCSERLQLWSGNNFKSRLETTLALIVSKNTQNITTQQFETIIFALCRLDAFRVRGSVGVSRTVLFALPGQACVPQLLPLIQKVFVHERHLFVYDDCCDSVEYGLGLIKKYGSSYRQKASKEEWELVSETPTTISATVPIAPLRHIRARALPDTWQI
eukprot:scaffold1141_cov73-Skeletonema_dohrnii-CCMP3373.AAC.2